VIVGGARVYVKREASRRVALNGRGLSRLDIAGGLENESHFVWHRGAARELVRLTSSASATTALDDAPERAYELMVGFGSPGRCDGGLVANVVGQGVHGWMARKAGIADL
jgi:hypothetical protein